jgi:hypothetical protein
MASLHGNSKLVFPERKPDSLPLCKLSPSVAFSREALEQDQDSIFSEMSGDIH